MNWSRMLVLGVTAWLLLVLSGAARAVFVWIQVQPDWALCALLYAGLALPEPAPVPRRGHYQRIGLGEVCALGVLLGYLTDLFAGAPRGVHSAAYAIVGLTVRLAAARLLVRGPFFASVVAALAAALSGLLVLALRVSVVPSVGWGGFGGVATSALATGLATPPLFALLRRLLDDGRFAAARRVER